MIEKRIYFDNAATSYPKPEPVIQAVSDYLVSCGNPGRGAHSFAVEGARRIFSARERVSEFLGIDRSENLIFTPGCTASINMVLKGLVGAGYLRAGDTIVTTAFEHNAVMRPLYQLKARFGVEQMMLPLDFIFDAGKVLDETFRGSSTPKLAVLCAASNVTGEVLISDEVLSAFSERGIPVVLDAAQMVGKLPVNIGKSKIDFLCASGHKGLLGPPGVGLLYVDPGFELEPLISGGTGSRSESLEMPTEFPDRLEAGTPAGHSIAGLEAGVEWLSAKDMGALYRQELELSSQFLEWANACEKVSVASAFDSKSSAGLLKVPIVSFSLTDMEPSEVARCLDSDFGIAVRAGLHCASSAHRVLRTEQEGLVRVSFGPFNSEGDVRDLINSLEKLIGANNKAVAARLS